jgi:hypothetical protein
MRKGELEMRKHGLAINVIAGALALAFTFTAQAQNNRSFVATTGNDANNCSASAYCRTFGRALAQTNSGGEIIVIDSGGYGPATIAQPVIITAIGIDASITATSGDALTINTTGNVTITGLNLNGGGTASVGVLITQVGVLRLNNMQVQSFLGGCVAFEATGNLAMEDSKLNDCANGLFQSSGQVYAHNTEFDHNLVAGAVTFAGTMTIADSSAHYNGASGFAAHGGTMTLFNVRAAFNTDGLDANSSALYLADSLISDNTNSYSTLPVGTMFGSSPGTSLITPGQSSSGSLGTAITLK